MKKTLLTIATMVAGILTMSAQCTAVQSCTPGASGYCATPASGSTLTAANSGVAYLTDIQFSLGSSAGPATITGATVTAVTGLPSGIIAIPNPTNGIVAPNSNACVRVAGTTTATPGTYTMTATFKVGIMFGTASTFTTVNASWYVPVSGSTGINEAASTNNAILVLAPNPAKSELTLTSDLHLSKATIIDALGKVVLVQELNYTNQAIIDIKSLERGVYFLQANDGTHSLTKKFIKD